MVESETIPGHELARRVRPAFPLLARTVDGNRTVYLDNAATSLKPQSVVRAMTHYYMDVSANIHRGVHRLSETASADYEGVRQRTAQFAGVRSNEVVFTANTTEALNLVASGLRLTRSDLVLVAFDSHHSNMLPWRRYARTKYVPLENLAISPQCGFASTFLGNLLTWEEQQRKLELVVEVARLVWG